MNAEDRMVIIKQNHIVDARARGRELAQKMGFSPVECAEIATVISELTRNMLMYAEGGVLLLQEAFSDDGSAGLQVVAQDEGPGIKNPDLAMSDGYSTSEGLGLGLPGTRRLMDDFDLNTTVGHGTVVRVVKWRRRRG